MSIKTGDIYFVEGSGPISFIIKLVTRGAISHVGIRYSDRLVFETDGAWGMAQFFGVDKYKGKKVHWRRYTMICEEHRLLIQRLCEKFNRTPYSYWDIALNLIASPMPKKWRHKFVSMLGTKAFSKCDEMTMRIFYKATGYRLFEHYESSNPSEMFDRVEASGDWEVVTI